MESEPKKEHCRLCPPGKESNHTTREHVTQMMQAAGTGANSVPDRVQRTLRSMNPDGQWSAIVHPQHPPERDQVWLALMSPERGYFVVRMADDVSDTEIRQWAVSFVAAPST